MQKLLITIRSKKNVEIYIFKEFCNLSISRWSATCVWCEIRSGRTPIQLTKCSCLVAGRESTSITRMLKDGSPCSTHWPRQGKRYGRMTSSCDDDDVERFDDVMNIFYLQALKAKNPHLFTLATLTGHEVLSYGYYAAIMDNGTKNWGYFDKMAKFGILGPAKKSGWSKRIQEIGDEFGQPIEISRLHPEVSRKILSFEEKCSFL